MKKAFEWLDAKGISYRFHDYKSSGVDASGLNAWADQAGWQVLVNTRGTTWRKLPEEARTGLTRERAIALMLAHLSLIRRPIVTGGNTLLIGFDAEQFEDALLA